MGQAVKPLLADELIGPILLGCRLGVAHGCGKLGVRSFHADADLRDVADRPAVGNLLDILC